MQLVKEIYILTNMFPKSELYGVTSQIRRAAISIPSNIAEGSGRKSMKEYRHSYTIAYGSALELETQIIIARDLRFTNNESFLKAEQLLEEVLRMLNKMTQTKKTRDYKLVSRS